MDVVALEILRAFGRLWLHPLTYLFFITALWFGIRRVKRERKDFHTRVYDYIHDLTFPLLSSLVFALALSIIIALIGIEIPIGMLLLIGAVWILFIPFMSARWLSMTLVGSIAFLITFFLPEGGTAYPWLNNALLEIQLMNHTGFGWLLVLLLLAESLLVLSNGWKKTTPVLFTSSRGKTVGGHKVNRLWFLPIFVLIPAGTISFDGWWPLFQSSGSGGSGFMFVPFILGVHGLVTSGIPIDGVKKIGNRLLLLGIIAAFIAGAATYWSFLLPVIAGVIIIGREFIYFFHQSRDRSRNSLFVPKQEGLTVLGVLPYTTADKLGIEVGETITKVNGWHVSSQRELYEALQKNSAYCKLEVLDHSGELRFAHSSIFQGDHYQIGLLFAPDDGGESNLSARGLRSSVVIHHDRNGVNGLEIPEMNVGDAGQGQQDQEENQEQDQVMVKGQGQALGQQDQELGQVDSSVNVDEIRTESMEEAAVTLEDDHDVLVEEKNRLELGNDVWELEEGVEQEPELNEDEYDVEVETKNVVDSQEEIATDVEVEVANEAWESDLQEEPSYSERNEKESSYGEDGRGEVESKNLFEHDNSVVLEKEERRPENGNMPYGQAAGLSAFYDEFRKTQPERNKWRPKLEEEEKDRGKRK
ncbi:MULTISPECIES: S1C family serine protease [Bacillaceae]|uniref:PDZ domain-containing protein n=1 Tax=Evansella alkalicola TaxID=745819 RepID=A0ABS6JUN1_9BACI|nr:MULTISPECIES: S1C family serine protease [Bacillaceae]MBU9722256.1 hypothetical protein [Bacillus alkalicola]